MTALALVSLACGDATGPTRDEVAGTYAATTLEITGLSGEAIDLLAQGGTARLVLQAEGVSRGTFAIPGFTSSLDGSWTLTDSRIAVVLAAPDYPGDLAFTVRGDTLDGGGGWPDAYLQLRVVRQRAASE